jgi:hypothetical protein
MVQPFPGLRSFWQTESDLFFGRERQIADLLRALATRKVNFVLGGSGSGKSSLVRAGVIPRLITASVEPQPGAWYAVQFRPGEAPSSQLFEAIITQIIEPVLAFDDDVAQNQLTYRYAALEEAFGVKLVGLDRTDARQACRDRLRQFLFDGDAIDIDAVIAFADSQLAQLDKLLSRGAQSAPPNLLILVDQFEEVFEGKVDADDRDMLISLIKQVWKRNPDRLYLIVTMRSEELHRCSEFEGLAEVINGSLYLLDLVEVSDLVQAMVGPASRILKAWGLDYAEPLTPDAIEQLQQTYQESAYTASSADRLPLIQHLLTLVWHRAVERWTDGPASSPLQIEVSDIQAIEGWTDREGPLRGCLTINADRLLKKAIVEARRVTRISDDAVESLIRAAFCTLARRDDRGNPKRDFATLEDMLEVSGVADRERKVTHSDRRSLKALRIALDLFQRANLVGTIPEEGQVKYNVNHEAFIRGWRKYREWLARARQCEDGLIDVDKELREVAAAPRRARTFDLMMEVVFADRERWAALIVTEDTARLLDDVLGPGSTFSLTWARRVLAHNDSSENRLTESVP